ncbi:Hypothetical predicted protein [Mytilus galloprovincialis]|uniref:Uncharacterized protein n=2 Tax=Mytilus TaxID=6548 RepID=A0A8B6GEJ0_MYTGA|nr:Hypothetical predicted protein [Mytilus galloprovincialis]
MHFFLLRDKFVLISWTLLIWFFNLGLSNSLDFNDKSQGEPDLDEWKKDLHLNDKLISQLYEKVNDFLIRKDLQKDTKHSDDTFEVNIPHTNFPVNPDADRSDISDEDAIEQMTDDSSNAKHKRSPCIGFRDSLSCFRSYLALWMLQRQGLKDPITLRNIGKRAYSFRNVGKRGGVYSFRNIGKRESSFSRNIDKRYAFHPLSDDNDKYDISKRDFRFPRSYFRNVGKRKVNFEGNKRMAFRNIGKRFSFRNVGKRNDLFDRINRMAFRNIGKKDSYFGRDDRMAFRNIGKKDSTFGRDERMSFRNIGKKDSTFERDERMAFRNIGKRDPLFERNDRMSFRNIGKRDTLFERDDRLAFRNIGKKRSSFELSGHDEKRSRFAGSSFRSIGKRNIVKDMSDVL